MKRIGVLAATGVVAGALFLAFSMFTAEKGSAYYMRRGVHFSATIPLSAGAPTTVFTVPGNATDLTITDIVYEFRLDPQEESTDGQRHGYHARLRLADGGTGANPTFINTSTIDTAIFTFVTDRLQVKQTPGAVDSLTTLVPLTGGSDSLDYTTCWNGTESHHFQTGIVIPSGRPVMAKVELSTLGGPGTVVPSLYSDIEVHITGVLE